MYVVPSSGNPRTPCQKIGVTERDL